MKEHSTRRPFGLNAIIVLQLLTALLSFSLLAIVVVGIALIAADPTGEAHLSIEGDLRVDQLVSMLLAGVINLFCAFGLWRRRRWAWFLTMLQLGVFMFEDLFSYFNGAPSESYAWSMLLNVIMVFYLNQRDVQAIFVRPQDKPAGNSTPAHPTTASSRITPSPIQEPPA